MESKTLFPLLLLFFLLQNGMKYCYIHKKTFCWKMNKQIFLRALIALLSMQLDNKARYSIGLRYILQKMRGF